MKNVYSLFIIIVLTLFLSGSTYTINLPENKNLELDSDTLAIDDWKNADEEEVLYRLSDEYKFIEIARGELGNYNGEKFWRWYGCTKYTPWCAIFVTWCGDQLGLIDDGTIPRFASVRKGYEYFLAKGQYVKKSKASPKRGDIIFFDYCNKAIEDIQDGIPDHVGFVEDVRDGYVYTIEGNYNNTCSQAKYSLNSGWIHGYGLPSYNQD